MALCYSSCRNLIRLPPPSGETWGPRSAGGQLPSQQGAPRAPGASGRGSGHTEGRRLPHLLPLPPQTPSGISAPEAPGTPARGILPASPPQSPRVPVWRQGQAETEGRQRAGQHVQHWLWVGSQTGNNFFFFLFCYKGPYWDSRQDVNKVCRLDANFSISKVEPWSWKGLPLR